MSWTNAIVAAVLLRFLDPYTAVEQTDDARIGASWASDPNHFPVPMGLVEPLAPPPKPPVTLRAAGKIVPSVVQRWSAEHWRQPRIVLTDGKKIVRRPGGVIEVPRVFSCAGAGVKPFWVYGAHPEAEAAKEKKAREEWQALVSQAEGNSP